VLAAGSVGRFGVTGIVIPAPIVPSMGDAVLSIDKARELVERMPRGHHFALVQQPPAATEKPA